MKNNFLYDARSYIEFLCFSCAAFKLLFLHSFYWIQAILQHNIIPN